jgi:hypothetical protein
LRDKHVLRYASEDRPAGNDLSHMPVLADMFSYGLLARIFIRHGAIFPRPWLG